MQTYKIKTFLAAPTVLLQSSRLFSGQLTKLPTQRLQTKKSIADIEEGDMEFVDHSPSPLADIEERMELSKAKLKWRLPHKDNKGVWFSKLRLFAPERQNMDRIMRMAKPWDFSIGNFFDKRRKLLLEVDSFMQSFIVERHKTLGNDLAAAHFLVHRGALVKFTRFDDWVQRTEKHEYKLPARYDPAYLIEELNCDNMTIYYEGFENIRRLHKLKKFSLQNVKTLDDWCMDRLCGNELTALRELDITGTNVTANGLVALTKMPSLKLLIVDNPKRSVEFELTLLGLQDSMPEMVVRDSVTGEEF